MDERPTCVAWCRYASLGKNCYQQAEGRRLGIIELARNEHQKDGDSGRYTPMSTSLVAPLTS